MKDSYKQLISGGGYNVMLGEGSVRLGLYALERNTDPNNDVPEPNTLLLLMGGAVASALLKRRSSSQSPAPCSSFIG
ncbi:MAG: PEP-CTERM sorting domain-containing protein [Betaproteobacteria bacterium]|nr:PEP-CTERM sorting domain-containing protein [Betaproteobacteria bacterium]